MTPRRALRALVLAALVSLPFVACSGLAEEGEACDRANGNSDCENGLVCRGEWEVMADEAVCCPRPPAKPSSSACKPEIEHQHPDPSIDASYGAGGTGTGGTAGSAGQAGSGGSAGAGGGAGAGGSEAGADADSDAAADAAPDVASDAAGD